ncbi:MAG: hydrolase [Flammeovirgaceae bacterium]|nr:hydrolase [Flammeovirgaceae bacterium]
MFSDFGLDGIRPFFSRRIGVSRDTSTGQNVQNPIYFGGRLSGKVNNNLRVGLLDMQAAEIESIGLPSTNYMVATFQQKIFARSNIGMIFVNKQAFQDSIKGDFTTSPMQYNRTLGIDFNLQSADNKWNGKFYYHKSFDEEKTDSTFATGARISYNSYEWDISATLTNTGANYNPEVGFVRRQDLLRFAPTIYYNFYPNSKIIRSHGPGFDFDVMGNQTYGVLDYDINLMYRVRFLSTANFDMRLRTEYTYLFDSFDPTNTGGVELPADTEYKNYLIIASFRSNSRNKFYFNISTRSGGYFNGTRISFNGEVTYRFRQYALFSLNYTYNRIELPAPYSSTDLYLLGPRIDITFTKNLFWTTFVQYNSQIENLNINSRFQWRFKPVSDLFFVYTDNYFAYSGNGDFIDFGAPKPGPLY